MNWNLRLQDFISSNCWACFLHTDTCDLSGNTYLFCCTKLDFHPIRRVFFLCSGLQNLLLLFQLFLVPFCPSRLEIWGLFMWEISPVFATFCVVQFENLNVCPFSVWTLFGNVNATKQVVWLFIIQMKGGTSEWNGYFEELEKIGL